MAYETGRLKRKIFFFESHNFDTIIARGFVRNCLQKFRQLIFFVLQNFRLKTIQFYSTESQKLLKVVPLYLIVKWGS